MLIPKIDLEIINYVQINLWKQHNCILKIEIINILNGLPRWLVVKNPPINAGDIRDSSLIPGSRRSPGGAHGCPPWYSCLENPMYRPCDRRAEHDWSDLACTHTGVHTHRDYAPPLLVNNGGFSLVSWLSHTLFLSPIFSSLLLFSFSKDWCIHAMVNSLTIFLSQQNISSRGEVSGLESQFFHVLCMSLDKLIKIS